MSPDRDPLVFSATEIRILRGMIDDHLYEESRSRFLGTTWKRARGIAVGVAAVLIFVLQLVTAFAVVSHGGN